jgi:hypothetical protein
MNRLYIVAMIITVIIAACTAPKHNPYLEAPDTVSPTDVLAPAVDSPDDDALEDPCDGVTTASDNWCSCNPQCCQGQLWFCPPVFGDPTYYKKEVIVDICDDNLQPCIYGQDDSCPPPEVIYMGECEEAYECPPSSQNLDYGWQWCEMADGTVGKQHITCDKGQLKYTPCQPCDIEVCDGADNDCDGVVDEGLSVAPCETQCGAGNAVCIEGQEICFGPEPQEEICDYLDNDCDGETDEGQLNACFECGLEPKESCNNVDDDCDGLTDEDLVNICSTACGTGAEVCTNGVWSSCSAMQPSQEICDGIDNDCNGLIDDGIECICTIADVGKLFPCSESPLLCGQGYKTCECVDPTCAQIVTTDCYAACYWLANPIGSDPSCDPIKGIIKDEECNNFDDNCNQLIDEDLFAGCYTGPEDTLGVGICESGLMTCSEGSWGSYDETNAFITGACEGEITPQEEICDGIDNDCDGIVDWGEEVPETDILFIVDWSGSMNQEISSVLTALNQFANYYSLQDKVHWGLVVGPKQLPGDYDERLFLVSDISPLASFIADFAALGNEGMNTGNEMLLDALYMSLQNISGFAPLDLTAAQWKYGVGESKPPKDVFNIGWRPGADRIIVVFSDEHPQSYLKPSVSIPLIISTGQATPQLKIYTFSKFAGDMWDDISNQCGGKAFPLTNSPTEMYNYLMEILDEICMSPTESDSE